MGPEAKDITLLDLCLILVRGKWKIFFSTFLMSVTALVYCSLATKKFGATISFISTAKKPMEAMFGNKFDQFANLAPTGASQDVSRGNVPFYLSLLESSSIMNRLVDRFHLIERYGVANREDAIRQLKEYTVVKELNGGIVQMTVLDLSKQGAQELAQAYFDELNHYANTVTLTEAQKEEAYLRKRVAQAENEMISAREALLTFERAHKLIFPAAQIAATLSESENMRASILDEQFSLETLSRIDRPGSVALNRIRNRIHDLESQLQELYSGSSSSRATPGLSKAGELLAEHTALNMEFELKQATYEYLLMQHEASEVDAARESLAVNMVDPPDVIPNHVVPRRTIICLAFAALGFLFGALALLMREGWRHLRTDPETAEEVSRLLNASGRLS